MYSLIVVLYIYLYVMAIRLYDVNINILNIKTMETIAMTKGISRLIVLSHWYYNIIY